MNTVSQKSSSEPHRLIIMTRYPVAKTTKTRLIPALGPGGAAGLQRQMTRHMVAQARRLTALTDICFTGGTGSQMQSWLGGDLLFTPQGGGDLGERMQRAFSRHFSSGGEKVVAAGCDCPDNRASDIRACFQALDKHGCVIGPASDGGYYMIGMRRPLPELFKGIDWGSDKVLAQTLNRARELNVQVHLLDERRDIDRPEDVLKKISVIIPALNEEKSVGDAIASARNAFNIECIVVDGGSTDKTIRAAQRAGALILQHNPCRAVQMNEGAAAAKGDILVFLHADTQLPSDWDRPVRAAMAEPGVAMGAFRFQVKERLSGIRIIEWLTYFRSRYLGLPYGDQALFMRAETFKKLGGFPDMPIMEDVELSLKAKRSGTVITLNEPALTSGRRWQRLGVFGGSLTNQLMLLGHALRVPPKKLARLYRRACT